MKTRPFLERLREVARTLGLRDSRPSPIVGRLARAFVPNLGTLLILGLIYVKGVGAGAFQSPSATATTSIPRLISYQGRLLDADGNVVPDGRYKMHLALYCDPDTPDAFWSETRTDEDGSNSAVPVSDGLFSIALGSREGLPASFPCDGVYLGITVGDDPEMEPRELLTTVPSAMLASTVPDGAITTEKIADGAVTSAKLGLSTSILPGYATVTTDADGRASIGAYKAVLKPAHYWFTSGGGGYWATDYDFNYDSNVGGLSGLPASVKAVIYFINQPGGAGNPVSSPPNW